MASGMNRTGKYCNYEKGKNIEGAGAARTVTTFAIGGTMEEEKQELAITVRQKGTTQKSGKGLEDLLVGLKTKEDWQLERLEDVERLTDIIHTYRVKRARSKEIACAIIQFLKEG